MVSSLQTILESARPGFAYQLLSLEIDIESNQGKIDLKKISPKQQNNALINKLSLLIQLYMLGVEVLESNGDSRYKYFNQKIQGLMKKKHVIQQLYLASTGKQATESAIKLANQDQIVDRKNQHEIQVFLNSEQCQLKKIKQMVLQEDKKYTNYKKKVGQNVKNQHQLLEERRKLRRMKSEARSTKGFDIGSNPPDQKERDFAINNVESIKKYTKEEELPRRMKLTKARSAKNLFYNDGEGLPKRKGSTEKIKMRILEY